MNDDVPPLSIFEEGAKGFGNPSHDPLGKTGLIEVLTNDTDADLNDTLTITDTHGVQHGTSQLSTDPMPTFCPGMQSSTRQTGITAGRTASSIASPMDMAARTTPP